MNSARQIALHAALRLGGLLKKAGLLTALALTLTASAMAAPAFTNLKWEHLLNQADLAAFGKVHASLLIEKMLLLGTDKGLLAVDLKSKPKPAPTIIASGLVLELKQTDEAIYVVNQQGLARLDPNTLAINQVVNQTGLQSAAVNDKVIYLGTRQGVYQKQRATNTVGQLNGMPAREVAQVLLIPTGLMVRYADQQLFFFDPTTAQSKEIHLEFNELKAPVQALMLEGDYLWVGTAGSGLIGYNFALQEWRTLKREHLVPYIFSLAHNGGNLWMGTHDAVAVFRMASQQLVTLRSELFLDQEIHTILLGNRLAVLGTSTGEWYLGTWQSPPTCDLAIPHQRHLQSPTFTLPAVISGQDPKTFKTYFKNLNDDQNWFALDGLTQSEDNLHYRFTYALDGLPKGQYVLRFQAGDATGSEVSEEFSLIQQNDYQLIKINNMTFRTGDNLVTGSYPPEQLISITIINHPVPVTLDPDQQQFTFRINLTEKDQVLLFRTLSKTNESKIIYFYFKVSACPVLQLSTTRPLYLFPGRAIEFNVSSKDLEQISRWTLAVMDRQKNVVQSFSGRDQLPVSVLWPWAQWHQQLTPATSFLVAQLEVEEPSGYRFKSNVESMILLKPDEDTIPEANQAVLQLLPEEIYFSSGHWDVTGRYDPVLEKTARFLQNHPGVLLIIEGHTDNRPYHSKKITNQILSRNRAESVGQHLEQDYHIDGHRLICMGLGQSKPMATNNSAAGRAKNRRVVMKTLVRERVYPGGRPPQSGKE